MFMADVQHTENDKYYIIRVKIGNYIVYVFSFFIRICNSKLTSHKLRIIPYLHQNLNMW